MMKRHEARLFAAATGDDEALALLVRAHHDQVYRYGLRVCRDGYDADDAVQEAFIKLASHRDAPRDAGALFWLFRVVRNACLRLLRPFRRERERLGARIEDSDEVPAIDLDPEAALDRWRLVHAVHDALSRLKRPLREVLVMRDLEGLTGEETCRALSITEANMKTRLHRARGDLRDELARVCAQSPKPACRDQRS